MENKQIKLSIKRIEKAMSRPLTHDEKTIFKIAFTDGIIEGYDRCEKIFNQK